MSSLDWEIAYSFAPVTPAVPETPYASSTIASAKAVYGDYDNHLGIKKL